MEAICLKRERNFPKREKRFRGFENFIMLVSYDEFPNWPKQLTLSGTDRSKDGMACVLLKNTLDVQKSHLRNPLIGGLPMDNERIRCIICALKRYRLTEMEKRFIELTGHYLDQNGVLTDQQESILEGIYREKKRWRKRIDLPEGESIKGSTL